MEAPEKNWLSIGWFEIEPVLGGEQLPETAAEAVLVNRDGPGTLAATEEVMDAGTEMIGLL